MIKFEHTEVIGWEQAIRGMRNPMNSWEKSDSSNNIITLCGSSKFKDEFIKVQKELSLKGYLVLSLGLFGHSGDEEAWKKKELLDQVHMQKIDIASSIFVIDVDGYIGESTNQEINYAQRRGKKVYYYSNNDLENIQATEVSFVGPNDHDLMMRLAKGGPVHAKYRRMIAVYVDITAPLYWWKEFDTYKVGTVANSCSTMHKIHAKEFTLEDFSCEHLFNDISEPHSYFSNIKQIADYKGTLELIVDILNNAREWYLKTKDKKYWWQMIQLLPSSYNQKRTVMLNYEVLANIYESRQNHRLDEWSGMDCFKDFARDCNTCVKKDSSDCHGGKESGFIQWIESLPYSEIITGRERGFTSKEMYELGKELQKGMTEGINKLCDIPEEYPVTACELCNLNGCGDSDEETCKKCRFYKYSKWVLEDNVGRNEGLNKHFGGCEE